jgi:hypothetical protein
MVLRSAWEMGSAIIPTGKRFPAGYRGLEDGPILASSGDGCKCPAGNRCTSPFCVCDAVCEPTPSPSGLSFTHVFPPSWWADKGETGEHRTMAPQRNMLRPTQWQPSGLSSSVIKDSGLRASITALCPIAGTAPSWVNAVLRLSRHHSRRSFWRISAAKKELTF